MTALLLLLFLAEYPKIDKEDKKERMVYITLIALGWVLALLLILHPDLPGPTELLNKLFNPLNHFLE